MFASLMCSPVWNYCALGVYARVHEFDLLFNWRLLVCLPVRSSGHHKHGVDPEPYAYEDDLALYLIRWIFSLAVASV